MAGAQTADVCVLGAAKIKNEGLARAYPRPLLDETRHSDEGAAVRVERYSYGPESDHFGDLWLPEADGPHPVVVNLHGGAWRERFGIQREDRRIIDLTQRGFACWSSAGQSSQ